jgi:hypothetical protein
MHSKANNFGTNLQDLIARQQKLVADLARSGKVEKAKAARDRLLTLLNQRDLSESLLSGKQTVKDGIQY